MGLRSLSPGFKVVIFVALKDILVKGLSFLSHLLIACRLRKAKRKRRNENVDSAVT